MALAVMLEGIVARGRNVVVAIEVTGYVVGESSPERSSALDPCIRLVSTKKFVLSPLMVGSGLS